MFSLTTRGLWAHKMRYLLTGLAVVLGVAFLSGTLVLTDTMERTFDEVFSSANDGTDVIVRSAAAVDGELTDTRSRVDASLVEVVATVEGVAVARGSIQAPAQLVRDDGEVAGADGLSTTIGGNWIDDDRLNPFTLATGRAPAAGEAVIDQRTADLEGWSIGDDLVVLTTAGPARLELVGTATYGDVDGLPGTTLVATDDGTAQTLFAERGRVDTVVVSAEPGVALADLADRIRDEVATADVGLEVLTGEQDTADQQASFREQLGFFNAFLLAFASIAVFVGTFIIYNTFSIVVAQRLRDLAMLRAIGARRSQVLGSIVFESALVGVVASAVGLVAGIGLSHGLRALLGVVGLDIPGGPVVVASASIITAFVVGVGASVLSAVLPAVRASRVRPIAALRDVAVDRSGVSVPRIGAGLALAAAGIAGFAAGVTSDGATGLPLLGAGALLIILGVAVLGPIIAAPAFRVLGRLAARVSGITGRYAGESARRAPRRAAATASALMIGVALVGFITILAASASASVEAAVERSFRADYVIESGSWDQGFGTAIEDDLAALDEVETLSPLRSASVEIDGSTARALAVDTAVFGQLFDLRVTAGALADVGGDAVGVRSHTAEGLDIGLGDRVPIRFADGETIDAEVAAVFDGDVTNAGDDGWLLGLDTFEAHVADQYDRQVYLSVDDDVPAAASRAAIEAAIGHWPIAEIRDRAEFSESVTAEVDQMLNLIYGLLALAVIIALIGIANTLALAVHERTRELGLLRAVGMQRRQVRAAVRWESFLIAVLGTSLGITLAVGGAWGIVQALDHEGITEVTFPLGRLAIIVVVAALAGVVAATGPARRAANLDILTAIGTR